MARNMCPCFRTFFFVLSTLGLFGKGAASDCYRTTTYQYKGHQNTTDDGQPCLRWDSFDHTYRDIMGSEDENYCRDPGRENVLWCYISRSRNHKSCGINKCVKVTQCGSLTIEKPRIMGRNATFTFTPDTNADADLKWQRTDKINPWAPLPDNDKFIQYTKDGTYYLILTNTTSVNDEVFYRVHYLNNSVSCLMETPKLKLQDISSNPCGFVYLRTTKVIEDEKVEIEYYPSENVLQNPGNFKRTWIRKNNQTLIPIRLTNGLYEEEEMQNDKYLLTISMFNSRMNGQYGVFCDQTAKYTDFVTVILPVPPTAPAFEGLQDIENCMGCIVGEDGDKFSVLCKTNGGTEPVEVTMSIGNESLNPQRNTSNETEGYMEFFILRNVHHLANLTCTVMNDALASPLTTTARVYVIKSPTFRSFVVPEVLKEGNSVNITCVLDSGRPTPHVILNISGTEVSSAIQMDYFNSVSFLYTSVVSLTTFERIWNKENITCCQSNEWYRNITECSQPKQVNYMFPPSNIKIEVKVEEGLPLQMYAVCTVYDSNPACVVNFSTPSGIITSERYTKNVSQPHGAVDTVYAVNLNVSKDDNGKEIGCAAKCPDFTVDLSDTRSIVLPYPPVIEFNISGSVLDIFEGKQTHVKCSAQSIPASNISWVEQTADGNITKEQCHMKAECSVAINAHLTSQRHFICQVHYLQTTDQKDLTINILEKDQQRSDDNDTSASADKTFIWIILGSCVAVLLVVFIVCLVARKKRRSTKDKQDTNEARLSAVTDGERNKGGELEGPLRGNLNDGAHACDNLEVTYSQPDKNKPAAGDDTTYSEVIKTGKSNKSAICSQQTKQVEGGQMLYADLDFYTTSAPSKTAIAKRRNTPTEYVAIDFVKTAAEKAKESESSEAENIYANQ